MQTFVQYLLGAPSRGYRLWAFLLLAFSVLASVCLSIYFTASWMLGIPALLLLVGLLVRDYRVVFYLLMASIPLSVEQYLPGGLGTDFPSEQLMWLLTLAGLFWFLQHFRQIDTRFVRHPISLALLAHLGWMSVCVLLSQDLVVSVKHWLAKGWYVVVFYFMAGQILNSVPAMRRMVWWYFVPLLLIVVVIQIRHAGFGFSYQEKDYVTGPFFRNHVISACSMAIFLPFVWFQARSERAGSFARWCLYFGVLAFLFGINFAYTRAAYVALVAAIGIYWVVRWRKMKYALLVSGMVMTALVAFLTTRDNWLMFAPDYERTVTSTRFESLLEATTRLEDISTMERVYRWVAASYMIQEEPLHGFGPGTFYFHYKHFTVSSFKTYVSDNPERSGIHNYFLMMCVEQGLPGFLLFVILLITAFMQGEKIYHRVQSPALKRMVMASLLCFVLINLMMMMNDLVETDKLGSLFFMSLAMLVNGELLAHDEPAATD
jgi:O-antigen ligase